jgi:putative NIF3 family GTP cyclohydrolase 1 type 2
MKANDIRELIHSVNVWIDWSKTNDQFIYGNPDVEVRGIATSWSPTNDALKEAASKGLNLFITHEPTFYEGFEGTPIADKMTIEKKMLLDELGMTVLRCHDTWDRMPEYGEGDALGKMLGFPFKRPYTTCLYAVSDVGDMTVRELAEHVREVVKPLGEPNVLVKGDLDRRIHRMGFGFGCAGELPFIYELKCDVILIADDSYNSWDGGLWVADLDFPIIMINHATSEKPGMIYLAKWLRERYPDIPIEYIDCKIAPQALPL